MKPVIPFEPVSDSQVPSGDRWIHQVKWDGVRMLTYYDGQQCRLYNRKLNERTYQYPELTDIREYCRADSVILDGEIIALGTDGKPSFHEVMKRDGIRRLDRVPYAMKHVSAVYMIFDLLYYDGEWVLDRTLSSRLELLSQMIAPSPMVQIVPSYPDGEALFQLMQQQGMEGIVSKELHSTYSINGKDRRWVKVKNYGDIIAVIGGYTLNGGIVNAVLVGVYNPEGKLLYIGHVGTGKLKKSDWVELTAKLKPATITDKPFNNEHPEMKGAYWVKPGLAVKLQFAEWRWQEGRTLRQPSIQAFVDVPPEACVFDGTL
ncbi:MULTISPECIES: RNA ligase family protein [unclassified Paenibacillus]|uniref:ATP-dependent DNA ligase n=1 Tax=unclassified Paenibacillus TaxID=185978 RepID=UPI001AE4C5AD|nr:MULTISPECIES: RNA ligase family protein [unclassified Paenibacillus]MBP1153840.1 bifunctional non-homologous end joining protein LigD [Paenibacillus sp. PvP091]MBP1170775.1 bifunctional non-homologous end joining protein LigD [Paenibacillus sp. PvR098]MBP2441803.1 bifunctional non-homologous end joining protein LigD [Paenibacillus sp. PvP052]